MKSLASLVFTGFLAIGASQSAQALSELSERYVLPAATETYIKSIGKELTDYTLKGVHEDGNLFKSCSEQLSKYAPKGTIAITDYQENNGSCSGTALIPKPK